MLLLLACTEYDLSGDKDHGPGEDPEPDAPAIDTGDTDADTGSDSGSVIVPPEDCDAGRTVRFGLAADDVWEAWVDNTSVGTAESWWQATWLEANLDCGSHVLAVYATDLHQAISGFIAVVEVEGVVVNTSADGSWKVLAGRGEPGWKTPSYDDGAWGAGQPCESASATGWWGGSPADLLAAGAWWLWPQECLALGDGSFRLRFEVE